MTVKALLFLFFVHASADGLRGASNVSDRCGCARAPLFAKCTGCPPTFNGKPCASTTRYNDMTKGSCGCGESDPVPEDWWTLTSYTMALNTVNLNPSDPSNSYCLANCGQCYELCSTGGSTQGKTTAHGVCKVFKVTNRCGDGFDVGRPDWCSQVMTFADCHGNPSKCRASGSTNQFGYPAHFDLQDYHLQISSGLSWDNVEVTFEPVSCDRWQGPKDVKCSGCQGR